MNNAQYIKGEGVLVQVVVDGSGVSLLLPSHWTVQEIEKHIKKVEEWLK